MNINSIEQGTRDPFLVFGNDSRRILYCFLTSSPCGNYSHRDPSQPWGVVRNKKSKREGCDGRAMGCRSLQIKGGVVGTSRMESPGPGGSRGTFEILGEEMVASDPEYDTGRSGGSEWTRTRSQTTARACGA